MLFKPCRVVPRVPSCRLYSAQDYTSPPSFKERCRPTASSLQHMHVLCNLARRIQGCPSYPFFATVDNVIIPTFNIGWNQHAFAGVLVAVSTAAHKTPTKTPRQPQPTKGGSRRSRRQYLIKIPRWSIPTGGRKFRADMSCSDGLSLVGLNVIYL